MWAGWVLGIFFLGLGMSSFFLAVTASSTDWQTPGVISNFITMPLMFASGALLPLANFPSWMQAIASVNPVSFSALLGRGSSSSARSIGRIWDTSPCSRSGCSSWEPLWRVAT